ncbi:hypothetical protein HNQ93_003342 [Hymenobacter luteus]|uniref:HEAT repeat domain-containing protein n=2 Tax=Hymenobacter TaxID=89966 RepID=A0A7W9T4A2_9BACT|nr:MULTISPECIES: DUF6493 family protein [Hymenobacter]MBB4602577.1 hypothetical protein [Hymenobacter latericoloratus]MBB6060468.1 hypothetical protein [Hymenobacter luteus]
MTTAETFEHIIRHQSCRELVPFLGALGNSDIVAVRQKTKSLLRELDRYEKTHGRSGLGEYRRVITPEQEMMLFFAGLATYSRKEAQARSFSLPWHLSDRGPDPQGHQEQFMTVLEQARPAWLAEWLVRLTRANQWAVLSYKQLRELEDRNLLAHDPWLFTQSVAHQLTRYNWLRNTYKKPDIDGYDQQILQQLQEDPTLLQRDLLLLFDYDSLVDSDSTFSGKDRELINWLTLLPRLVASGHLNRPEVLTRCLLALRRDFRRPLLTWFKNLFLALQPTPAERLARQTELVDLLAHPLPLVINFALDQLKELWTQPAFDAAALLLYADALVTRQDLKTGLRTLFNGLEKLLKQDPTLAPTLSRLSTTALTSADASVQERAAKLLKTILGARKPLLTAAEAAETTDTISLYTDLLTPAARTLLGPYLTTAPTPGSSTALAAAYAPATGFTPDISEATVIAPVRDWHELLFLTGELLQHNSPVRVERWLDGLGRLRGHYPADYAQQLRPYIVQTASSELKNKTDDEIREYFRTYSFGGIRQGRRELLVALLISWYQGFTQGNVPRANLQPQQYSAPDPLLLVEQARLAALEQRLHTGSPALPLLSTPSHAPHWVAPSALVQRLLAYQAASAEPAAADLALALTRTAATAPDDAAAARLLLPQLQHPELRALLEWYLAPQPEPAALPLQVAPSPGKPIARELTERLGKLIPFLKRTPAADSSPPLAESLPWLWVVAARTRLPYQELPALAAVASYPGVAQPWLPGWHFEQKTHTYKQSWNKQHPEVTNTWQELLVHTPPVPQGLPNPLLLYSYYVQPPKSTTGWYSLFSLQLELPFLLSLFPQNPDPLYWHLIRLSCRTDNSDTTAREVIQTALHALLAAGPAFSEPATLLLALGLTHSTPAGRAVALEVLLASVDTGRLVPDALGRILGKLLAVGFAPVQRLSDALAQARAISPLLDDAVGQVLDELLPLLPTATPLRNTRKLLEAYTDVQQRTTRVVPAPVAQHLQAWSQSAALRKAAASLLTV